MKTQSILVLAMVVMLLAVSPTQATPVANVSTSAAYQTIIDSDSDASYIIGIPAATESLSEHPDYPYPSEYAISNAWATIGGSVEAFCKVQGGDEVSPPPPENMKSVIASASAAHTADWLVTSDTLELDTPVLVLLDVTFTGELQGRVGGAPETSASASLAIDEITLYEAGGYRYRDHAVEASGEWVGDFQGGLLDSNDIVSFDAVVGQTIKLALSLQAEASIPQAWEASSTTDFSNSGFYTFVGAEDPLNPGTMLDVNFEMVPEPATLLLLGFGAIALRKRKRRA